MRDVFLGAGGAGGLPPAGGQLVPKNFFRKAINQGERNIIKRRMLK